MSKLIAMVATAVFVDGVRTVIQPGEELPDLSKHDKGELVKAGAAKSNAADAEQAKREKADAAAAAAEFEAARKRVLDAQTSTAAPAAKTAKAAK